jgi:hypothetical protein
LFLQFWGCASPYPLGKPKAKRITVKKRKPEFKYCTSSAIARDQTRPARASIPSFPGSTASTTRDRRRSHPKHGASSNNNPTATPSAVSRALVNYTRLRRRGLDPLVCMHRQEARHSRSPGEGNDGVLPAHLECAGAISGRSDLCVRRVANGGSTPPYPLPERGSCPVQ